MGNWLGGRKRRREPDDDQADAEPYAARAPRRARRTQARRMERAQFDETGGRMTAHFGPGRWARYTRGAVLGVGSAGRVSRYDVAQASHADLSSPAAVKEFAQAGGYAGQREVARFVAADPVVARLMVDATPVDSALGGRIVMPALREPTPADGAWRVWSQARDAVTQLRSRGFAYFDLKLRNLLIRPDGRVLLGDIDGLRRPGAPLRRVLNTYAYPGHDGQLMVDDHNVPLAEQLCTHFALAQLALALLNRGGWYVGHDAPLLHAQPHPIATLMHRLDSDIERAHAGPEWDAALRVHGFGHNILRLELNQLELAVLGGRDVRQRVARCTGMLRHWDPRHETPEAPRWAQMLGRGW
jgi:hypothetical protein